jgi:tRNA-dihydrouridine synthase A
MADFDARYYGNQSAPKSRMEVVRAMFSYVERGFSRQGAQHLARGITLHDVTRHMLGLMAGLPGARRFRQILSDSHHLSAGDPHVLLMAAEAVSAE